MKALVYLLSALAVMGLAFWAYRENYRTQARIDEMQAVQQDIARLRDDLGVLRAEWAYLNRPERLRELVDINFARLRLAPVQAGQFGGVRNVDYPDPAAAPQPEAPQDGPFVSNNRGAPAPRPPGLAGRPAAEDLAPDDTAQATADPE